MIKSVTVTNPKGESLKLTLTRPEESGLMVKKIEGLGPGKANLATTELSSSDGGIVNSSRLGVRNIVLTLAMLFDPTIEDARQKTYRYFPIKKKINLLIETDNRLAECDGIVESNEPDIFSEAEETQISIICEDPFLYDLGGEAISFAGVIPLFEFPFENNSLDENLLEFGEIRLDTRTNVNYVGDMDTGFLLTFHALNAASDPDLDPGDIIVYNTDDSTAMKLHLSKLTSLTGAKFSIGDDVVVSTYPSNKYCRLYRNGAEYNVISIMDKDSEWFKLSSGDNNFEMVATGEVKSVMLTFSYRNAYGGI